MLDSSCHTDLSIVPPFQAVQSHNFFVHYVAKKLGRGPVMRLVGTVKDDLYSESSNSNPDK